MRGLKLACALVAMVFTIPAAGGAVVPGAVPNLPIAGAETAVGSIVTSAAPAVAPAPKTVDGDLSDWTGDITRLGGTAVYSRGEYVYQDFIGDAWGADDGFDAERLATLHALKDIEPRTYRVDALQQAAGAQFDAPRPIGAALHYGDTSSPDAERTQADIEEVRFAADASDLYVMVRTVGMQDPAATAVLVLLDTEPGGSYTMARSLGGLTTGAEFGLLASRHEDDIVFIWQGRPLGIVCGGPPPPPCPDLFDLAFNSSGFTNAMEIRVSRALFSNLGGLGSSFGFGLATGIDDPATNRLAARAQGDAASDLINVAFRREPARIWMDERQALALRTGTIDEFLAPVSLDRLTGGYTETFTQRPGYYEAIYVDANSPVNREQVSNAYHQGVFQHYGVYLPKAHRPGATLPATFWMHYRGGHAHDAAAWEPGILRAFGDDLGAIVVTPSARGESSWYTGRGMVDFLGVWDEAMSRWSIDDDRVYLAGHSMGGWASNFLGLVFPDRWAASNPEDGLLVPGLWAGAGDPMEPQNGADVQAEFLYPLLGNARNVPFAILHGTLDELVPVSGVIAHGARLHELGYRYRAYLFHGYEHYSAPIWDDWQEVIRYFRPIRRDRDPAHVTYSIKPALDHAASTVSVPDGVDLGFRFDRAYWVSGLRTRTPGIDPANIGTVDATSYGRGVPRVIPIPEAGTAGQPEPYTMHGQAWLPDGAEPAANRFAATLTNLSEATLDVARMGLGTSSTIDATVTTDGPVTLRLTGSWPASVTVEGASWFTLDGGVLEIRLEAAGTHTLVISPA
ncbi:MAG: prolyl oligopeptidase family serine peptidase [Actinomycetota bacterium]